MSNQDPITNDQDYIDSRDIINREEYLRHWAEEYSEEVDPVTAEFSYEDFADEHPEAFEEMRALQDLMDLIAMAPDYEYGITMIRDSYFETYARELAEDIGAVENENVWPTMFIDWEAAADALRMDYFSVDFDGVTYWVRG